jgi:hypothetical protein
MRGPAPTGNPAQAAPTPAAGAARATPVRSRPSSPRDPVVPGTPAYGVQRPPPQDFALARTMAAPGGMPPTATNHPPFPNRIRVHHETARVQFRAQRQWGGLFTVLVLLLGAAAVGVHVWWMPLDVLITWGQPTGLAIATEPAGATLRVDGVPLAATAPLTVSVARDRVEHVVEATLPGYKPAREKLRYDKAASLRITLRLQRDPNAAPPTGPPGTGSTP